MAAGTVLLLPVDVVAQGVIQHSLELAALALCDLAQRGRHLGRGRRLIAGRPKSAKGSPQASPNTAGRPHNQAPRWPAPRAGHLVTLER